MTRSIAYDAPQDAGAAAFGGGWIGSSCCLCSGDRRGAGDVQDLLFYVWGAARRGEKLMAGLACLPPEFSRFGARHVARSWFAL